MILVKKKKISCFKNLVDVEYNSEGGGILGGWWLCKFEYVKYS